MDFAPFYAPPERKVQQPDLIKGLVTPSKVRMNQEGWTIMNILRFFFSLSDKRRDVKMGAPSRGPAVKLLSELRRELGGNRLFVWLQVETVGQYSAGLFRNYLLSIMW